ncbi:glycoside hydrolase [Flavobacterium commune]|uniref:Glycosyl hydrolase n=1 Tax=Flavobacterium commune TaxID=1306519 RepID=A0A1D9PC03_9FLAO|nr:glycoside hydrolase [Flavobacterium commune]APA00119.1 glycosyl hydrolase [Flavobacterium commune]
MRILKIISASTLFTGLLLIASCSSKMNSKSEPTLSNIAEIKIDLNQELQTMDGFGASDAWRCQMVGKNWPLEKRNGIADLLFSKEVDKDGNPKGIGLSIWRFYLGAGSAEQGLNSGIADEWRRSECFQNPDGSYDWTKQAGQRWFLQAAKSRGVEKFLAFTISPPVQMTLNGKAFSPQKLNMNIKKGMLPNYADFLVETIDNLQRNEGITFDYLSPINEPQWDWMAGKNGLASQEGTPATNQEMFNFTKLLSERIHSKSLKTEIVLGEAAIINYLYENVNDESRDDQINTFFGSSSTNISQLPHVKKVITGHSYFSIWPVKDQISYREKLSSRLKQIDNLKYWQTEYSILEQLGEDVIPGSSGHQRDLGMKTALFAAQIIHNDIAVANASSWQWWTALSRADFKDGLIYLDDGTNNGSMIDGYCKNDGFYHDSKLLWAFGNYSRFVRPGMIRLQIENQKVEDGILLTAYKDVANKKVVIVAVNNNDSMKRYKLNLSGSVLIKKALTPYTTSETMSLKKGTDVTATSFEIPARAVVTYVGIYK